MRANSNRIMMHIYRLYINGGGRAPRIYYKDDDFLYHHYQGKPEGQDWQPPQIGVVGKSYPLKDVLMCSFGSPIVSDRFRAVMEPICAAHAEFLPLTVLRRVPYFVFNVTEVVDCLDKTRSRWKFPHNEFYFDEKKVKHVPVFKVPESLNNVFVTDCFVIAAREAKLTGIGLDDPNKESLIKMKVVEGFPT
jgi:hypothetical protein